MGMSMGYRACWDYVIDEKDLKTIGHIKEKLRMIHLILEEHGTVIDEFAKAELYCDEIEDKRAHDRATSQYKLIQKEFAKETGMRIYIGYHDSETDGSRYDEVDGTFWYVIGMRQFTKEGLKFKDVIKVAPWVEFG